MEWQPIETAPNEGEFLVYGGEVRPEVFSSYPADVTKVLGLGGGHESFVVADGDYHGCTVYGATHWMPLPPPPSEPGNA